MMGRNVSANNFRVTPTVGIQRVYIFMFEGAYLKRHFIRATERQLITMIHMPKYDLEMAL